ncbi:pilus assembly protein CpaE [Azospirillaceae bacterium]
MSGGRSSPGALLAFLSDEASRQAARNFAVDRGWPEKAVLPGSLSAAVEHLAIVGAPQTLVVDAEDAEDIVAGVRRLIGLCPPETRVIVVGAINNVSLYRALLAVGAADYLVKPLQPEALAQAQQAIEAAAQRNAMQRKPSEPAMAKTARLIVVIGARGGVGATTLAVNAAWLIAHELGRETAFLDLDLQYGAGALALDLEPGRGLREALESPDRLDSLLIASSMVNESDKLCVLGAEEPLEDEIAFNDAALGTLLHELRSGFDCVVVDMPRARIPMHRNTLAHADHIALVSDMTLAGIRDVVRINAALKAFGRTIPCLLVAGRSGGEKKTQIDQATFERSVQEKIVEIIPEDSRSVTIAANQGKAIAAAAPNSPTLPSLRNLSRIFADIKAPQTKTRWRWLKDLIGNS